MFTSGYALALIGKQKATNSSKIRGKKDQECFSPHRPPRLHTNKRREPGKTNIIDESVLKKQSVRKKDWLKSTVFKQLNSAKGNHCEQRPEPPAV